MTIKSLRFITLILAALTMGMTFAHTLELLPKLQWEAPLYLSVQTSLYALFGTVGPVVEIGALLSASALTFLVRKRRPAFLPTLAGTVTILLSLVVWLAVVQPANGHIAGWQATGAIPPDWTRWRDQWQFGQMATFVLHLLGFGALAHSVIIETP